MLGVIVEYFQFELHQFSSNISIIFCPYNANTAVHKLAKKWIGLDATVVWDSPFPLGDSCTTNWMGKIQILS